jgi:hypothetical protein
VGTAVIALHHPSVTATRGTRTEKHREEEMVAAADCAVGPQPFGHAMCPEHFEKALEAPCPFHGGQAKNLLKDCAIIRGYIRDTLG